MTGRGMGGCGDRALTCEDGEGSIGGGPQCCMSNLRKNHGPCPFDYSCPMSPLKSACVPCQI